LLARLKSVTNPESGAINYQYDANGNLTKKMDAWLIETSYSYDALNRVTIRDYSERNGQTQTEVDSTVRQK
jgi:YD repeat-containing protein